MKPAIHILFPTFAIWLSLSVCTARGAGVSASGTIGPHGESWTREYPIEVDENAQGISLGEHVRLSHGSMRFELFDPKGKSLIWHQGGEFMIGPVFVRADSGPGKYNLLVTAAEAAGKWQFATALIPPRNAAGAYLAGGLLMVIVAATGIVYWRRKTTTPWKWFLIGAALWALAVAMKVAVALVLNSPILKFLETHLGENGYLVCGSIYIGLLTGIFEFGLVAVFALRWRQMAAEARQAVAIGVGAGAIEAALLGLGVVGTMIATLAGVGNLMAVNSLMYAMTPLAWMVGPVERLIAILCHVSARTLALAGVARGRWWPFWGGFAILTGVDAIVGWAYVTETLGTFSLWWIELAILPLAIVGIPLTKWAIANWPTAIAPGDAIPNRSDTGLKSGMDRPLSAPAVFH